MYLHRALLLGLICITLVTLTCAADSQDDGKDAAQKSSDILANLYLTLRNIAFPKSPYSTGDTATQNRFVFMSPGKVLNYYDYYPGDAYAASVKAKNMTAPETLVPPSVMEKWFDIADVVVSGDLNGGTTGKQMSVIYDTILSQMSIKNFKTLYVDAEANYNEARQYLTEPVQNPINLTENTTRMFLYSFYQEEYAQRRLDMEEKINSARKIMGSLEYELWFQRNYKMLNAKVESSYSKWLVFGQKDLVELYKTYMDTTSAGAELEDARIILRSSGVNSLDRTRTIYPVSFEPSNWYEYLLPKKSPPSRDMLITRRSMLQSELDVLNATIDFMSVGSSDTKQAVDALKQKVNYTTEKRDNATREALRARNDCVYKNAKEGEPTPKEKRAASDATGDPCDKLNQATDDVVDSTFQQAQASSEFFSSSFLLKSDGKYKSFLQSKIQSLNREIQEISAQLNGSQSAYLGEIADSKEFTALNQLGNKTEQDLDSEWLQFEYDYDSSHIHTDENKKTLNVAASFSGGAKGASLSASGYYSKGTADLMQAMNSASLKVSGELLRVTIKRPWFRPSLFENPTLFFVQVGDDAKKSTYVAPPPSSEDDLRKYINGERNHHYLLPEYVTSFLLARNLKLQFSGLRSSSVSHAMQMMAGGSVSGSYDMFSVSASVGIGREKQSVTADRTTTGMIISIPGAQVIGYYTQVMPEFPRDQN